MKKSGYIFIVLAIAAFLGYFYVLYEPLQAKHIDAGTSPSLLFAIGAPVVLGLLLGYLTFTGMSMNAIGDGATPDNRSLAKSTSFLGWAAAWILGLLIFTLIWKYTSF